MLTLRGLAVLSVCIAAELDGQAPPAAARRLAIANVSVIDATGSAAQPRKTVLIAGDRIEAILVDPQRLGDGAAVR